MNCDEGQYHLSHIYDELLLNGFAEQKINWQLQDIGKKISDRQDELSQWHSGDERNRCFWNVHHAHSSILFGSENMKYIYWYLSTDPDEPV